MSSEDSEVTSENQACMREDRDCWCPRQDEDVLILSSVCCFPGKTKKVCCGCTFDGNWPLVKIMILLSDMPKGPQKRKKVDDIE
jgi:hypothetical protein